MTNNGSVPRVAVIPGDGIGPEVIAEARKVLSAAGFKYDAVEYDLGAARYVRTGEILPDSVLDELAGVDAIMLGAIGSPQVPPGVLERGLLLRLRFEFDLYVNLRPVHLLPGAPAVLMNATPDDVDFAVVRENTEGPYIGEGGLLRPGTLAEIATQGSVNTRSASSAACATPSTSPAPAPGTSSRSATRRTCSPTRATSGSARSTPSPPNTPT